MVDDRGHEVEVLRRIGFCAWPVAGDRRIGVMRARVRAEMIGKLGKKRGWRAEYGEAGVILGGLIVSQAAAFGLVWLLGRTIWVMMIPLAAMIGFAAVMGYVLFNSQKKRSSAGIVDEISREGLCASCGYNLHGIERADDGCVVCPECGAAWRGDRIRRSAAFADGATMSESLDSLLNAGRLIVVTKDDRGTAVVVPRGMLAGKEPAEAVSDDAAAVMRVRRGIRRRWLLDKSVMIGMAVAACGGLVIGKSLEVTIASGLPPRWTVIAIGAAIIVAGLGFNRVMMWSRKKVTVRDLLREGLCPGCLSSMKGAKEVEGGLRECGWCGAAWREGGGGDVEIGG